MNCPCVFGANCGVCVPELSLKHLTTGVVETAGVLAVILSLAADFRNWTGGCSAEGRPFLRALRKPQGTEGLENLLGPGNAQELLWQSPHLCRTSRRRADKGEGCLNEDTKCFAQNGALEEPDDSNPPDFGQLWIC